jgi:hypothetical protein
MSNPKHDNLPAKLRVNDLAGTPACKEEDRPTVHLHESRGVKDRGRGGKRSRGGPPTPSPLAPPTADDLAGIPVAAESEEDLTVRPRKSRQKK